MMSRYCLIALAALELCSANFLFRGATIIAWNETLQDFSILRNASLLVKNDRIAEVSGDIIIVQDENIEEIDATDKIITPGFVNTHTHLWQTAFKTLGSNTSLADYTQKYSTFSPANGEYTAEDTYISQLAGSLELLYEGTTSVLEHAHGGFTDDIATAEVNGSFDSGLRTFYAFGLSPLPAYPVEEQLDTLRRLANQTRFLDVNARMKLGFSYDWIQQENKTLIDKVWQMGQDINASVITVHDVGGPWGFANSPQLLHRYGWLNTSIPVVFSHSSYTDSLNARLLRLTNQYISTTPESELHFGHGNPFVHLIQDQASLGSDCHFTYSAGMVGQARLWLQHFRGRNFQRRLDEWTIPVNTPISVRQAFHMITRSGALALRQPDLGVIRAGAKADLVVFDTTSPVMLGWDDPIAAIILHSNTGDIRDVLIDGKFVKRGGKLTFTGYADIQRRFLATAKRLQAVWKNITFPPLENGDGSSAIYVSPYSRADVVDIARGNVTGY